eukprot:4209361-Lingulodinium_polyedra.AAC.1
MHGPCLAQQRRKEKANLARARTHSDCETPTRPTRSPQQRCKRVAHCRRAALPASAAATL